MTLIYEADAYAHYMKLHMSLICEASVLQDPQQDLGSERRAHLRVVNSGREGTDMRQRGMRSEACAAGSYGVPMQRATRQNRAPEQRAQNRAPLPAPPPAAGAAGALTKARSPSPSALPPHREGEEERGARTIWKVGTTARRTRATRVRAEEVEDTTAVDEMAAAAKDSTAEASMAGDSAGAAEQTAEAAEAPSANPTCGARHRRVRIQEHRQVRLGEHVAGSWAAIAQAGRAGRGTTCEILAARLA